MTSLQPSEAKARQSAFPRLRAPPVTRATRPLIPRSMAYLPLNWAGRFWKNAWMPSPASSVFNTFSKARSSISRA